MLVVGFALALVVEFGLPMALGLYLRRRYAAPWRFFLYGALIFAAFQLFTRVPAVAVLSAAVQPGKHGEAFVWAWIAGLSLSAGVFEEVGRYVGYRWLFRAGERTERNALMFGAGHGGFESMALVGVSVLSSMLTVIALSRADVSQLGLSADQAAQVRQLLDLPWWMPLLGAFERVCTIVIHVSLSLLVLRVFQTGRLFWLWLAVGYHGLMNFAVAGLGTRLLGPVGAEVVVAGFAVLSAYIIYRIAGRAVAGTTIVPANETRRSSPPGHAY